MHGGSLWCCCFATACTSTSSFLVIYLSINRLSWTVVVHLIRVVCLGFLSSGVVCFVAT